MSPVAYWPKSPRAITAWNLLILAVGLWDSVSSGQTLVIESVTSPGNPLYGPMSFGLVVVVNLIYGAIVSVLSDKPNR